MNDYNKSKRLFELFELKIEQHRSFKNYSFINNKKKIYMTFIYSVQNPVTNKSTDS